MDTLRNERWAETNMVSTLLCADRILSQPGRTLVCYGDVVFHPTIAGRLLSASEDLVISYDVRWLQLWKARFDQPLSDAESFRESEGWLVDIGRKVDRLDEVGGQFMGLLLMSQQGWASVRTLLASLQPAEVERLDTTALLRRLLHAGERIRALAVEGRWCEVDTQADLDGYERQLGQAGWSHDWRWQSER
jgi:choline kinase